MKATRRISRRSFAAAVLGTLAVGGGATALVLGRGDDSTRYTGATDSDAGQTADTAGYGSGTGRGYTDQDVAPVRDAENRGRGPGPRSQGQAAAMSRLPDRPKANGCSDADVGAVADAGGAGRACAVRRP